jgi:hypothetical protein
MRVEYFQSCCLFISLWESFPKSVVIFCSSSYSNGNKVFVRTWQSCLLPVSLFIFSRYVGDIYLFHSLLLLWFFFFTKMQNFNKVDKLKMKKEDYDKEVALLVRPIFLQRCSRCWKRYKSSTNILLIFFISAGGLDRVHLVRRPLTGLFY